MTITSGITRWTVPPSAAVWIPAWTRFSFVSDSPVIVRLVFLEPARARGLLPGITVVALDDMLVAVLARLETANLAAGRAADRRLFAVLLDRIAAAPRLALAVPQPPAGTLDSARASTGPPGDAVPALSEIAASLGVSRRTVERTFLREVGMTAGRWRRRARFARAVTLLAGGWQVQAVAREAGYRSPSAFVAAFRRELGTTPRRFAARPSGPATRPRGPADPSSRRA